MLLQDVLKKENNNLDFQPVRSYQTQHHLRTSTLNNLTFLRWVAALLVLYGHAFVFLGLPDPLFLGQVKLGTLGVQVFFGISGYLVMQSWEHDPNVYRFLQRRALRIFPGLMVCITLSALVLGPALTSLPMTDYLKHPATLGYFENIFLYITFHLPGVFEHHRVANAVNGSLWSLPAEFSMYLGLALLGMLRLPRISLGLVVLAMMALSALWASKTTDMLVLYRTDLRQVVIYGVFFWVGAIYQRYRVERLFTLTNVGLVLLLWISLTRWPQAFMLSSWFILPFVTLAFGLAAGSWLSALTRFDYSYGIYIYAFPVQQTLVHFWPDMNLWLHVALAAALTIGLASLSWHLIEKKALAFKPVRRVVGMSATPQQPLL